MDETRPTLTIHVASAGFKFGGPPPDPHGHGVGFVFDCRALPNPFWDERLRPYSGREAPVVAFMDAQPEVQTYGRHALAMVLQSARIFTELGREHLRVNFACTGGRHRSVYMAEWLARELEAAGYRVALTHHHADRPGAGAPLAEAPGS